MSSEGPEFGSSFSGQFWLWVFSEVPAKVLAGATVMRDVTSKMTYSMATGWEAPVPCCVDPFIGLLECPHRMVATFPPGAVRKVEGEEDAAVPFPDLVSEAACHCPLFLCVRRGPLSPAQTRERLHLWKGMSKDLWVYFRASQVPRLVVRIKCRSYGQGPQGSACH